MLCFYVYIILERIKLVLGKLGCREQDISKAYYMSKIDIYQSRIACRSTIYIRLLLYIKTKHMLYSIHISYPIHIAIATMSYIYSMLNTLYYISVVG